MTNFASLVSIFVYIFYVFDMFWTPNGLKAGPNHSASRGSFPTYEVSNPSTPQDVSNQSHHKNSEYETLQGQST